MIKQNNPSMSDVLLTNRTKKIKNQFFMQIDTLIDWKPISKLINKYYIKKHDATGRPAFDGLMMFKICLLQSWYGLSDYEAEDRINDSLSFSNFVGLSSEDCAPDHSTICRFRNLLVEKNVFDRLLKEINRQLEGHSIIVKVGALVDASIVESPYRPRTKPGYEIVKDRDEKPRDGKDVEKEQKEKEYQKVYAPGVDTEAAWLKKGSKVHYGFKKHYVTDSNGLVIGVATTAANVNEITNLEEVLDTADLSHGTIVFADKGYQSAKNNELLENRGLKNRIMKKARRNRKLTPWEIAYNKLIGKIRFKVERTFGSIKRWFNGGRARYKGIVKTHGQNVMEAIGYNLYRSPGIVMSNSMK
jgi:IS5 family transposase